MSVHNSPMSADFGNNSGGESTSEPSIDPPTGPLPQSNAGGVPTDSGAGMTDPIDSGVGAGAIDPPPVLPPSILDGPLEDLEEKSIPKKRKKKEAKAKAKAEAKPPEMAFTPSRRGGIGR